MPRTHRSVIALCWSPLVALLGCTPRLTPERVIEDLGQDDLVLTVFTVEEQEVSREDCRTDVTMFDDERDAADAAGWTEEICKGDPRFMKLTAEGRKASVRWQSGDEFHTPGTAHRWDVPVAHYERSGTPVIRPGATSTERLVMIPGRWIPNEDGKRLYAAGWKTITTVNREVKFMYLEGIWACHLLGR